jgi:hypothetical protein
MGWIENELSDINIGDKRLNNRAKSIIHCLDNSSEDSFPQCFKSRAELEGAYRFFNNNFVNPEKILSSHYKNTLSRCSDEKVVLLVNDSSSIDYTSKSTVEGLGILETSHTRGIFIHPLIALNPSRVCLGMVDLHTWIRDEKAKRRDLSSQIRMNQPIEEKESFRWISCYRKSCEIAKKSPKTQFVTISDRESDILEYIVEAVQTKQKEISADVIIRVKHDRKLQKDTLKKSKVSEEFEIKILDDEEEQNKLKSNLLKAPIIGEIEFTLSARDKSPERKVKQTVRSTQVQLNKKKVGTRLYDSVQVNAVTCVEENPPKGKDPICWMFLTTLPIDSFENTIKVVKYYLCRWEIEVYFKIFKSGCKVEERELKTVDRIQNLLALFSIIAWRIMYLTQLGRKNPEILCTEIFEESEWKSVCKIMNNNEPKVPPSLGEILRMIALLGGYIAGKNRPPPGPIVIWRGLKRMRDFALMWEKFQN